MLRKGIRFMFDRKVLKENGKAAFKKNYWLCVLVSLILLICVGGLAGVTGASYGDKASETLTEGSPAYSDVDRAVEEAGSKSSNTYVATISFVGIGVGVLSILVFAVIEVGGRRFYLNNRIMEKAELNSLGMGFKGGVYGNIVLTMFLRDLFTCLWSLLLIVPGVIKYYEYILIPYILAENPEMDHKEAFRISKELMMGNKWDTFVLELSFFGWMLLSVCTGGLVGIFYMAPYMDATLAELYMTLKEQRLEVFSLEAE